MRHVIALLQFLLFGSAVTIGAGAIYTSRSEFAAVALLIVFIVLMAQAVKEQ